jgi:hypothetical protein
VEKTQQRNLVLILARELAANSATPMFVIDPTGTLVFFNEPAEHVLGRSFAETGPLSPDEWGRMFAPIDEGGEPIPLESLPLAKVMRDLQPGHMEFKITALDEVERKIAVTAFPLFAKANEFVGAVAIFWERSGGAN